MLSTSKESDALLLPRVCFNRHHMAEGVKTFNNETWKTLFPEDAKLRLCELAPEVAEFYVHELQSENH